MCTKTVKTALYAHIKNICIPALKDLQSTLTTTDCPWMVFVQRFVEHWYHIGPSRPLFEWSCHYHSKSNVCLL